MSQYSSIIYDMINKYKEQLNNNVLSIENQKNSINKRIEKIINGDNTLLNKYYLNNLQNQIGGDQIGGERKFNKETIDKLDTLNNLFTELSAIDTTKLAQNNEALQKKTTEILDLIETISGKKSVNPKDLVYKLPQFLDSVHLDLKSYDKGLEVFPKLVSMYAPLKEQIPNLLNSTALESMLKQFKKRFEDIKSKTTDSSVEKELEGIKADLDKSIGELQTVKDKMKRVNKQLTKRISTFEASLIVQVDRRKLNFVNSVEEFIKDFDNYCKTKTDADRELKDLHTKYIDISQKNLLKAGKEVFDFITEYNKIIKKVVDLTISGNKKLPSPRYNGTDTKPIANNMINTPDDLNALKPAIKNLLKIKLGEDFDGKEISSGDLDKIYKPTFSGGAVSEVEQVLSNLSSVSNEYRQEYVIYVRNTEKYNKYSIYDVSHSIYLLSILSNSLFVKSGYQVYKYIGRGMINFYKRIIESIYKDLKLKAADLPDDAQRVIIAEIRKKYFLTVVRLKSFLENLSQLLSPKDIIDIDLCADDVLENFMILNHFKIILEKYNESRMNKLTIYGRVNDIMASPKTSLDLPINPAQNVYEKLDAPTFESLNNNQDYKKALKFSIDNKLFISDYDRRNIYAGYFITKSTTPDKLFNPETNRLLKRELRPFPEMLNGAGKPYDPSVLYIYDTQVYEVYLKIKEKYNANNSLVDKLEELEKFKKIDVAIIIEEKFNRVKEINTNISNLNQEISELEGEISDVLGQIDDIVADETTDKKTRKDNVASLVNDNESLNTQLADKRALLNTPTYNKELADKLNNDIKNLLLTIKLALEYLYAINPEVSEKLLWVRNFTCDAQKSCAQTTEDLSAYEETSAEDPKKCEIKNKKEVPLLNSYKFTEVFDTQNFPNNSDMAAYMCLNSRLTGGNGVCLITYGYSGTGKSYTLFGKPGLDGLLQGTLNKLDGLDKIYFRLFEIYGKGLPYKDYWTEEVDNKQKTKIDKIYNYLYAYKLSYNPSSVDKISVNKPNVKYGTTPEEYECAVELYGDQIKEYINKIDDLRKGKDSTYKATDRREPTNASKVDLLEYLELSGDIYQTVFQKFKNFTDKIEQMRINTQRVRETPNNKVSSRSILVYDFVLMINIDGKKTPVSFLIIDLPGREEIAPTFINKYTDHATNPILHDIIKKGFEVDTRYPEHRKLLVNETGAVNSDTYMKELKAMLAAFTLNPISVPIYASEIIEKYLKDNYTAGKNIKEILDKKLLRKYTLRGELNGQFSGNNLSFEKEISIYDEFYDTNFSEKFRLDDPEFFNAVSNSGVVTIDVNNIHNFYFITKHYFNSRLGWNTFNNLLAMNDDGSIYIHDIVHIHQQKAPKKGAFGAAAATPVSGDPYETPIDAVTQWNQNHLSDVKVKAVKKKRDIKFTSPPKMIVPTTYRYVYGLENDKHNGRQIKTLFFMHLLKRLFDLQRYDIVNDLFKKIVDEKINYYIREHIKKSSNEECKKIVLDLIENNFKREALRDKFMNKDGTVITIKNGTVDNLMDRSYNLIQPDLSYEEDVQKSTNIVEYLFDAIKYDFYTTGFEGVYINENIIGLIKYLGKDGKPKKDNNGKDIIGSDGKPEMIYLIQNPVDRSMIEIIPQEKKYTFEYGYKIGKMVQMSRMPFEGKQKEINIASDNIKDYGALAQGQIDPASAPGGNTPGWAAALGERRKLKAGGTVVAFMEPKYTKYDRNKKIKIFDISSDNYINQLFTKKSELTSDSKDKVGRYTGYSDTKGDSASKDFPPVPDYGDYFYNSNSLDEVYTKTIDAYKSSKIFCVDEPIIKSILEPYLDIINDFKIFYLFGNYTKATRELKCAQQFELLETTNNFIEAITR